MNDFKQNLITKVLKSEVTKALGCTEVGLIGYAVSLCNLKDLKKIEKITLKLDLSSFKNDYSVGVPNTGKFGIIPAVVGGFLGKSENKLLIFDDINYSEELEQFIKEKLEIQVLDENTLYCKVEILDTLGNLYESLIKDNHLNVLIPKINNEEVVLNKITVEEKENYKNLEISDFLEYLGSIPRDIENLIIETIDTNKKLVKGDFLKYGNDILANMVNKTASACKTRMSGENMPAMSVAKSGNMGIMATLPIISYDESTEHNNEKLIKSILFSILTTIYAAYHTKSLSSMCGCVNKGGIGALSGLCYYIYGKNQEKLLISLKSFTANIPGIICDGGKVGCALKLSTGCFAAYTSTFTEISSKDGIVGNTYLECIENIGKISSAMGNIDKDIVKIITSKED